MKKLKNILFILLINLSYTLHTQIQLSVYSEVSIITVGAGDNLYEAFGHSAIRVKDPVLNFDLIYNYGVFDFNAPHFYTNFTKGKLLYKLIRYDFDIFLQGYQQEKRWMKEQVLDLTPEQKTKFFLYLENNAQPENATYLYDPFFNNCASKLITITQEVLGTDFIIKTTDIENIHTLRSLMNNRIHWNTWGSFGINLALGSKLDLKREVLSYTYLPEYVYLVFEKSELKNSNSKQPIVVNTNQLLNFPKPPIKGFLSGPLLFFSLLAFFILRFTLKDYKNKSVNFKLDVILFFVTGLIGCLLVFLWFFTNHSTTQNNFNVLWAFMPNLLMLFFFKKSKMMVRYYQFLILLLIFMFVIWVFKIQLFPIAIIPFLLALFVRYIYLQFAFKKITD